MASPLQKSDSANHHYVPKFYLKGFTDRHHVLWVCEKGATAPRGSNPRKEGHRENYYAYTNRGDSDNSAEGLLSRAETIVAPVIRKLANRQFTMTDQQRIELYSFIALTFVRVPAYREFINEQAGKLLKQFSQKLATDREDFSEILREYEDKTGQSLGNPEKLRQFVASDDYTVTLRSTGFNLLVTFDSYQTISKILESEYRHDIFYSPASSPFVTCDNPIVTIELDQNGSARVGTGFGRPKTQVLFPLNKRACIILSRTGIGKQIAATEFRVEQINNMMMGVAQRFLYAPVGYRRLARIFNERGCKVRYGENAFITAR